MDGSLAVLPNDGLARAPADRLHPMTPRSPWPELLALGAVALVMRIGASFLVADPAYLDPAYYELVARHLATGAGFSIPVIWSFLDVGGVLPADPQLPIEANRHWMPMTAIVSAGSMALFGSTRLAAELPHAILGAALVSLTGWIGWSLWRSRMVAVIAGILALFAGPMLVYVPMVDSFALFGAFGSIAILAAIRAIRPGGGGWWLVLAGVAAALATLTRIDGALLGLAPASAWLARRGIGPWRVGGPPISAWWAVIGVLAGLAVLAPWLARQLSEFGSILPSAGGRLVWITSYNEQFSITGNPSLGTYLDEGVGAILASKAGTLGLLIGRTAVLLGGALVLPFFFGLWRERGRPELAPFLIYWVALFAVMVLLFTVHAPFGAYYHSAWAWLPFALPLAAANGGPMLEAVGSRLPMLRRPRNMRFLAIAALVGGVLLSVVGSAALVSQWRRDSATLASAAAWLRANASRNDVVMYVDPPSLNLMTGNPVVAPPFDPPGVIGEVAHAYDVEWVVVERAAGSETDALGLWDGEPWLADPIFDKGDVRIFPAGG
jgi:4-amino-4-deoxy-L-arabinose transferase-like glycosyltransferase